MSKPRVLIYTTNPCSYCRMAKMLMEKRGIVYEEKLIFGGTPEWEEMLKVTKGAKTVPQIVIDEKPIGGYPELLKLQESGELDTLMASA